MPEERTGREFGAISEIKVHPPTPRTEWIERPRLLARLSGAAKSSNVLVAAPAGYGKSTLVAQWVAAGQAGTAAWLSLDPGDNDPTRLWIHLAAALERVGCVVDANIAEFLAANATVIDSQVVPRVAAALNAFDRPLTIVLEDLHVLRSVECTGQLGQLLDTLPAHVHLVLISRADPALHLARLRVEGRLAEIRTVDLSFTRDEIAEVLDAEGVQLSTAALRRLARQTEGWPAAVYLAALSLAGRSDADDFITELSGSDRFIADYLSEEVLGRLDEELRDVILGLSIFERFSVPLANHVLQTTSSAAQLRQLERTNLFLIPLHGGGWYRFHHLFAAFARGSLEATRPGDVADLHRRGAAWFAAHDLVEETVRHTIAAGDLDAAATLIHVHWVRLFDAGRTATVAGWLDALRGSPADRTPAATVTGAWLGALTGNPAEMRRRLTALAAMPDDGVLADGTRSTESALVLIRGIFGYDGPDQMLADSRRAVELETDPSTPWYAVARASLGAAAFVVGDFALARRHLPEAYRAPVVPMTVRVLALGVHALGELEDGHVALGSRLAEEVMAIVTEHGMQAMPQATFAFTAYGGALAAAGRWSAAAEVLEEGLRPRRQVPGLSPWPLLHHLAMMAYVAGRMGDCERAEDLLAEAEGIAAWPDASMARTHARIADVRHGILRPGSQIPARGARLTPRETEILHRLHGTQTLREIAADLYVSHNTVKTTTLSIYRKLGAHSRQEAVALSREHPARGRAGRHISPG